MISQLEMLNEDEKANLFDAIPLITILIAGADGDIDADEIAWSEKLTKIRGYAHPENLQTFYEKIGENYSDKLKSMIAELPNDVDERTKLISDKLANLNGSLARLDVNYGARLYKSFVTFAEHVAKASGGFLGFASISREEKKLIGLEMIAPIVVEESEETGEDA